MQQKKLKLKFQAYQEPDTKKRTGYIYNKMKKASIVPLFIK